MGGGFERRFGKNTLVAGGLYYGYTDRSNGYVSSDTASTCTCWHGQSSSSSRRTEHRITLRIAGEREISPGFTLRGGMSVFGGLPEEEQTIEWKLIEGTTRDISSSTASFRTTSSSVVGATGSLGASFTVNSVLFEPYIHGGFTRERLYGQAEEVDDAGWRKLNLTDPGPFWRNTWHIGSGFSVR